MFGIFKKSGNIIKANVTLSLNLKQLIIRSIPMFIDILHLDV